MPADSLIGVIAQDVRADVELRGSLPRRAATVASRVAIAPRLQAVILYRLSAAASRRSQGLAAFVKYVNHVLTGADIAYQSQIGPGLQLFHPVGVVIGADVVLGARCSLQQGVTLGAGPDGSPRAGDDVRFGPGAKLYDAIVIGDRARIGANAVVQIDVPADAFAAGVPARVRSVAGRRELGDTQAEA